MKSKQMKFGKFEQEQIKQAAMVLSEIMLSKLDEGREIAELEIVNNVENENRQVTFSVIAKTTKP